MRRLRATFDALQFDPLPILAIGLCYLSITMMWTLYSAYVPVFLLTDYDLPASAIGFVMMLDNLAALAIQPWIGARSDRLRSVLGRRLPIILVATPFAALGFGLIPHASDLLNGFPGFLIVLSVMLVAMAAIRVPLFALMPDLTPSASRSTANGILNLLGGLGTLLAALGLGGVYRATRAGPFWLAGGMLIVSVLLLVLTIWRRAPEQLGQPLQPQEDDGDQPMPANSLWIMLRDMVGYGWRRVPLLLLAILLYTFGFNAIETFFSVFGLTQLHLREEQALALLGFFFIGYLLASVPAGILGGRYGRHRTMTVGLIALACMLGAAFYVRSALAIMAFMPLGGLAWALVNSNALPAVINTAPSTQAGSAVGLFYATSTLASVLSPLANGSLVDWRGGNYAFIILSASLSAGLGAVCLLGTRSQRDTKISLPAPLLLEAPTDVELRAVPEGH